jgi:hypothetical protein
MAADDLAGALGIEHDGDWEYLYIALDEQGYTWNGESWILES